MIIRYVGILATVLLLAAGCAVDARPAADDAAHMEKAAGELVGILWNVDYRTFTHDRTTAYARKYYDGDFLSDYLQDIRSNSGEDAVKEEKLIANVLDVTPKGQDEELLGDTVYKSFAVRAKIHITNYEPLSPEDSFFEAGRDYDLIYTLYFKEENGALKLSAYAFEPENEPFLPKRANNRTLTDAEVEAMKKLTEAYFRMRYDIDYRTYDVEKAMAFHSEHCTGAFLDGEGISKEYFGDFQSDIRAFRIIAHTVRIRIERAGRDKSLVESFDGPGFYYMVTTKITYHIEAADEYYRHAQIKKGEEIAFCADLGFEFADGQPKIAYAAYE